MIVVLAGMPGTGKSTVARRLAERHGAACCDVDARLAAADPLGRPAARILAEDGEAAFRAAEADAVAALADELATRRIHARADDVDAAAPDAPPALALRAVVATGGWAVGDPASRARLEALGPIVCLTAPPAVLASRLAATAGDRPLLPHPDEAALAALLAARRSVYDALPWQVNTEDRTVEQVADAVWSLVVEVAGAGLLAIDPFDGADDVRPAEAIAENSAVAVPVSTSEGPVGGLAGGYSVLVGEGLLDLAGPVLVARGVRGRAIVVSDGTVADHHGARLATSLYDAGLVVRAVAVRAGEASKSVEKLAWLWNALAEYKVERGDTIVALGGGVVTDLAGFAAATYLRGVRWVAVPTSLLGMVDAAIGGKTGIDLAAGKNLVGAFHAPALVVCDVGVLATLPAAARAEGLAELVKAAVLDGEAMLADLEAAAEGWLADWARGGHAGAETSRRLADWVARGVAVKARHVAGDLREARGGLRERLNLGHTFAHGLEVASGYRLPHGQAVAIGLVAAARLAAAMSASGEPGDHVPREAPDQRPDRALGDARRSHGRVARDDLAIRLEALLGRLGLPTRWQGDVEAVIAAMAHDKKREGGALRFVLPHAPGDVAVRGGVVETAVRRALGGGQA